MGRRGGMKTLTTFQLSWMLDHEDPLVISVLDGGNFEAARGPGSPNIPISGEDFVGEVERLAGSRTAKLVLYCAGPDHEVSRKAAERLEDAGFRNVYCCEGGLKALQSTGWQISRPTYSSS